jgi:SAM-dependent methyltransferase
VKAYQDHFSVQAAHYARYRPDYPDELFAYLASQAGPESPVWDCATGSGQAASGLARHFAHVWATDASEAQIRDARVHERIEYGVAPAERSGLPRSSVGLVTVAQALHWFNLDRFYAEVRRVLVPGGLLAVWTYSLMSVTPQVDEVIGRFHDDVVGRYWPGERKYVIEGYASIPFPFEERPAPAFRMTAEWEPAACLGYLYSWSAVQRYVRHESRDPVAELAPALRDAWGGDGRRRTVTWPLQVRVGVVGR